MSKYMPGPKVIYESTDQEPGVIGQSTVKPGFTKPDQPISYWAVLKNGLWRSTAVGAKYIVGPVFILCGIFLFPSGLSIIMMGANSDFPEGTNGIAIGIGIASFIMGVGLVLAGYHFIERAKKRLKNLKRQSKVGDLENVNPSTDQQMNSPEQNGKINPYKQVQDFLIYVYNY